MWCNDLLVLSYKTNKTEIVIKKSLLLLFSRDKLMLNKQAGSIFLPVLVIFITHNSSAVSFLLLVFLS